MQTFIDSAIKCDFIRGFVRLHKTPPNRLRMENTDNDQVCVCVRARVCVRAWGVLRSTYVHSFVCVFCLCLCLHEAPPNTLWVAENTPAMT